jgi:hypothetical protein
MKIGLILPSSIVPVIVSWKYIPEITTKVYYKGTLYVVIDVYHNMDESIVKIMLRRL